MNKFSPLTFGYEWETLLLKSNLMFLEKKDVEYMAHHLRKKFPWSRTGLDYIPGFDARLLEIRSGILSSFDELKNRTDLQVKEIEKICKEKKWGFFPIGVHPAIGGAIGLHCHIGSIYDFADATRIANLLTIYAPAFAALSCNSSVWAPGESGEYKSYRILKYADYNSMVRRVSAPSIAQWSWGDDVCVKTDAHSTIELRIGDAASSRTFVSEYVAFVTAFITRFAEKGIPNFDQKLYIESIENRWKAAKYGLQAIFLWNGQQREITDILREMLNMADFKKIGCKGLSLIPKMIELKQTQADWQNFMHKFDKDHHRYAKTISNILNREDPFTKYLSSAPVLPSVKPMKIEDYILSYIGKETPIICIYELLQLPYYILNQKLKKLVKQGKIKRERSPEKCEYYSRLRR